MSFKKSFCLFLLFQFFGTICFAQKLTQTPEFILHQIDEGKFEEALTHLNQIKDKETLENTTVSLYRNFVESIVNHKFHSRKVLQDSIFQVTIKSKHIKAQGVYNSLEKKYVVAPVYDSIIVYPFFEKQFIKVFKKKQQALLDVDGKVIIPLGEYGNIYPISNELFVADKRTEHKHFIQAPFSIYNLQGELILDNQNLDQHQGRIDIPHFIQTRDSKGKVTIFDVKQKKVIYENLAYCLDNTYAFHNNEIADVNLEAETQRFVLMKAENGNFVYHVVNDELIQLKEFDTYIDNFTDLTFLENQLSSLINLKKNVTLNENQYGDYDKYIIVKKNNKFGIYNLFRNTFYKQPIYDSISSIGNTFYQGKWMNLIFGKEIIKPFFNTRQGLLFKENNKVGLLDYHGKILAEPIYDDIKKIGHSLFYLRKGKKWGFVNTEKDAILVEPNYDYFDRDENYNLNAYQKLKVIKYTELGKKVMPNTLVDFDVQYSNFENDLRFNVVEYNNPERLRFQKNGLYGLADSYKNEIVPPIYTSISLSSNNNFLVTKNETLFGLIDENGKQLIPPNYLTIDGDTFSRENLYVVVNDENVKAIFNGYGEMVHPFSIHEIKAVKSINDTLSYSIIFEENDTHPVTFSVNQNVIKSYGDSVLKLEKGNVFKVDLNAINCYFLSKDKIAFTNKNNKFYGFYHLLTGEKSSVNYSGYMEMNDSLLIVKKGNKFDTLLDNSFTETPLLKPFDFKGNNSFFFKENNVYGVMNYQFKEANFKYPILKPFYKYSETIFYPEEFKTKANTLFLFSSNAASKKLGLINFSGKIIAKPERFDAIHLLFFKEYESENVFKTNEFLKPYKDKLFYGVTNFDASSQITIFTEDNTIITQFEKKSQQMWRFAKYNQAIILQNSKEIEILPLNNKGKSLTIPVGNFQEREDGSYLNSISLPNNFQKTTIYDVNGKILFDKTFDRKEGISTINYENYIAISKNKYGIYNAKSEIVVPFNYDYIEEINAKTFIAKRNTKFGIIDYENTVLLDFVYDTISKKPSVRSTRYNTNTFLNSIEVKRNQLVGLFDAINFKTIIPVSFDAIKIYSYSLVANKDSLHVVFDFKGNELFKANVDSITVTEYSGFKFFKKGKEVFMNKDGEIVVANPNKYVTHEQKLKLEYCVEKENKHYLSHNNQIIHSIPISTINEQNIEMEDEKTVDFLLIEDEQKKLALFDKSLNNILPFAFDEISVTNNLDFLIVKQKGKFGVVNFKNQIIIPIKYDQIEFDNGQQLFKLRIKDINYKLSPLNKVLSKKQIKKEID